MMIRKLEDRQGDTVDINYSVSYSPRRNEVYVYDLDDNHIFSIQDENVPDDVSDMSNEELTQWVLDEYTPELIDHDLIDYPGK